MNDNIWAGDKVMLRAWEPGDWEAQVRWRRDTEGDRRTYRIPLPFSDALTRKQAEEYALQRPEGDRFRGIVALPDGSPIGVIAANDCEPIDGFFSIAYYIEPEERRKGYASEAVRLLLRFYFLERRYQKANAGVYDFNQPSQDLLTGLGFQLEGRQRRMQFTDGSYCDLLWFGITVEEFRDKHAAWLAPRV